MAYPLPHSALAGEPEIAHGATMALPPLTAKMLSTDAQPLPRQKKILATKQKIHPAMKQAHAAFAHLHSAKFFNNAGRFGKKSAK